MPACCGVIRARRVVRKSRMSLRGSMHLSLGLRNTLKGCLLVPRLGAVRRVLVRIATNRPRHAGLRCVLSGEALTLPYADVESIVGEPVQQLGEGFRLYLSVEIADGFHHDAGDEFRWQQPVELRCQPRGDVLSRLDGPTRRRWW